MVKDLLEISGDVKLKKISWGNELVNCLNDICTEQGSEPLFTADMTGMDATLTIVNCEEIEPNDFFKAMVPETFVIMTEDFDRREIFMGSIIIFLFTALIVGYLICPIDLF